MANNDDNLESGPEAHKRHLGGLVKDLMGDMSSLIRLEIALARAQLKEKAVSMAVSSALILVAAFFGLLAAGVLTATFVLAISVALPAWAAALIVTGAYLLIAGVLALIGVQRLSKSEKQAPEETKETTKEGVSWEKKHRGSKTT